MEGVWYLPCREDVAAESKFLAFFVSCFVFQDSVLCVALVVLELGFVDQAGLELTDIHLPRPPKCWD